MKRRTETEREKDKVDIMLKPITPEVSTHFEIIVISYLNIY
jgi:hypothetical protein